MKPSIKISTSSPKTIKIRRQSKLFLAAITEEFKLKQETSIWSNNTFFENVDKSLPRLG